MGINEKSEVSHRPVSMRKIIADWDAISHNEDTDAEANTKQLFKIYRSS